MNYDWYYTQGPDIEPDEEEIEEALAAAERAWKAKREKQDD